VPVTIAKWIWRLIGLAVALVVAPLPLLVCAIFAGGWTGVGFAGAYGGALFCGAAGVLFIALPGLVILDFARTDGIAARLSLGAGVGVASGIFALVEDTPERGDLGLGGWLLYPLLGAVFGLLGAWAYWTWFEQRIRDIKQETDMKASLTPEERRKFGSRLDRNPW